MRQTKKANFTQHRTRPDNIKNFNIDTDGTLLEVAALILRDHNNTKLKSMLKHNQFAVNGTPTSQYNLPVHAGDVLNVNFDGSFAVFNNPRVKLVYEDSDIMVINKGYGLLSVGNNNVKEGTVFSILRDYVKTNNAHAHIYILHRLDRDTSGLMLIAKTPEAQEIMQHNWNNMVLERKYVAVVEGEMENKSGEIKSYLAENSKFEVYSTDNPEEGQLAITRYKTLQRGNGFSLVELELATGRKNQIRVHMKDLGHPVSGDRKYGAHPSPIHRVALHAHTLRFVHPATRKLMEFKLPVPTKFSSMLKK